MEINNKTKIRKYNKDNNIINEAREPLLSVFKMQTIVRSSLCFLSALIFM